MGPASICARALTPKHILRMAPQLLHSHRLARRCTRRPGLESPSRPANPTGAQLFTGTRRDEFLAASDPALC